MGFSIEEVRKSKFVTMSITEEEEFIKQTLENNDMSVKVMNELLMFANDQLIETYFIKSPNRLIRMKIAKCKNLPKKFLKVLLQDDDELVRVGGASNKQITVEVQRELAKDESVKVRKTIAENTNSEELILILKNDDDAEVRSSVASNECTPEKVLEELAHDEDISVRRAVAQNNNTPFEVKKLLACDRSCKVRYVLAFSTNQEILTILSKDRSLDVLEMVCHNLRTPSHCLATIYSKKKKIERIVGAIANNFNTPSNILAEIYNEFSKNESVLRSLATNPNTPKEIAKWIAKSQNYMIRGACAYGCKHRDILLKLTNDTNEYVLSCFAFNKIAMHDEEIIIKLLNSPNNTRWIEELLAVRNRDLIDVDWTMLINQLNKKIK